AAALAEDALLPAAVERATAVATELVAAGGAAACAVDHTDLHHDLTAYHPRPPSAPSVTAQTTTPAAGRPARAPVVVATGGCFDLLHAGHVSLLQAAAALGDRLVVLLNSDRSVARLKGPDRPIQPEADRRAVLLALGCVDDVVIFDDD